MKAVLTNRIFLDFREDVYLKIKEELTYKIPSKMFNAPPKIIRLYKTIGDKLVISIPSGRIDLIPDDYEVIDRRASVEREFPEFKFELYKEQKKIFDKVDGSCLIDANPSWGKTFTGIAIAAKLKQKTLVIVHTLDLRDQWRREIKKTLGIDAGFIEGKNINLAPPISVVNIQTLRKHTLKLKDEFGTVMVDEVHHAPSKVFSETLNTFTAKNKIGLSGTLKRKDFMHVVLTDYFCKDTYTAPRDNQMTPDIHIFKTGIELPSNAMIPWATRVNQVYDNPEYQDLIFGLANSYAERGHKVLVLCDRTYFLEAGHEFNKNSVLVIGTTKDRRELLDEVKYGDKDIIYGAISIFKEGISEDHLSCVILATPVNNEPMLEQIIGRVQRIQEDKITPVCVDIVLKGATGRKQAYARASFYANRLWPCTLVDLT